MSLRSKIISVLAIFTLAVFINVTVAVRANTTLVNEGLALISPFAKDVNWITLANDAATDAHHGIENAFDANWITRQQASAIESSSFIPGYVIRQMLKGKPEDSHREKLRRLLRQHEEYREALIDCIVALTAPDFANGRVRQEHAHDVYNRLHMTFMSDLGNLKMELDTARHEFTDYVSRSTEIINWTLFLLASAEVAALIVLRSLFYRWMLKPIAEINKASEAIGAGDLSYRIDYKSQDELGALAGEVNRMADSLQRAQRDLKQSERMAAMGEMVSVIAHNIRNPLAGIRAAAQSVLHAPNLDSKQQHERIIKSVDSLEQWLRALLHLNRPLDLKLERIDLQEMFAELEHVFEPTIQRKKVSLKYENNGALSILHVDRQHFMQALASIIDNAIEASPVGSEVRITSKIDQTHQKSFIEVVDSGSGIPESLRVQVFESYFSTKPGGTGIGLSMARKIIEAHSGSLSVINLEGKTGAAIRIELPLHRAVKHVKG